MALGTTAALLGGAVLGGTVASLSKTPKAPPAPDYAAAAQQQGQANLEAARLQARLSNPNIQGPLGGQKVTYGRSTFDQTAYDKAMAEYNKQLEAYNAAKASGQTYTPPTGAPKMEFDPETGRYIKMPGTMPGIQFGEGGMPIAPTKEQFTTMTDLDTPFIEQYLNPEAEAAIKAQQRVQEQYALLGEKAFKTVAPQFEKAFAPTLPSMAERLTGYGEIGAAPTLRADYQMGFTPEGLPITPNLGMYGFAGGGPAAPGQIVEANLGGVGGVSYGPQEGQYGYAQGFVPTQQLQERLDLRNVAAMPISAGATAQQAIFSRLTPQLQQRRAALENQLANQGIPRGSEAYREAMTQLSQQENDLVQQAALQGINLDLAARGQGFQEAQAQAQLLNQARQAQFGMGATQLGLYNQALQQNLAQGLSVQEARNRAQAQDLQQRLAMGQFGREGQQLAFQMGQSAQEAQNRALAQNQAAAMQQYQAEMARQAQGFGQRMDLTGLYNQAINAQNAAALQQYQAQLGAQGQQFNQAQAEAAFRNAARTQALQEQAALRAQPLNEIAALMGGSQVQMPQFQGYTGAPVAPAPVFGAAQAQAQFAQNNYANQVAAYNAQMQGLYGLGAAGIQGYFSRPAPSPTPGGP